MPNHVYKPQHNPPTWLDRLLVHPTDTTVAFASTFFGVIVALSLVGPHFVPSASMEKMPVVVVALVGAFLIAGGVLSVLGLNWTGHEVTKGWALERFGWLLSFGGFGVFSLSVLWSYPASVFSWGLPLWLGIGCLIRLWSIARIEKTMRDTLAVVKEPSE